MKHAVEYFFQASWYIDAEWLLAISNLRRSPKNKWGYFCGKNCLNIGIDAHSTIIHHLLTFLHQNSKESAQFCT